MTEKEKAKEELWCEAVKNGHTMQYRALGISMSPFIRNGSILTIAPNERIFIGDVILYKNYSGMTAHRVIRKKKSGNGFTFITKGDSLKCPDEPVKMSDLLGKVVKVEGKRKIEMDSPSIRVLNYFIAIASSFLFPTLLPILRRIKRHI
jgi:signal peptidase I